MSQKPETRFLQNRVKPDLKKLPHTWFFKTQEVSVRGIPDIIACVRGVFVALELKKSSKDTLDPLQKHILALIKKARGHSYEVNPDNWPEVYKALQHLAKGEKKWLV